MPWLPVLIKEERAEYRRLLLTTENVQRVLQEARQRAPDLPIWSGLLTSTYRPLVGTQIDAEYKNALRAVDNLCALLDDLARAVERYNWPNRVYDKYFTLVLHRKRGQLCGFEKCLELLSVQHQALVRMVARRWYTDIPRRLRVLQDRSEEPRLLA
jgi:hypothetical protein